MIQGRFEHFLIGFKTLFLQKFSKKMNTESNHRDHFSSNLIAVLAAAGSAVGLGNIWRFPYVVDQYGQGAFILIYLAAIVILGIPLLAAEFAVGHYSRKNPVGAYNSIRKGFGVIGVCGVASVTLILGYYLVVGGWTFGYTLFSASGKLATVDHQQFFDGFSVDPIFPLICAAVYLTANHVIIARGVKKGIEQASKLLMPILFLIILGLAIHSLCNQTGRNAVIAVFTPDFSQITFKCVLAAVGQAFYSLSVGIGCMVIYGSYFDKDTKIISSAINVAFLDTAIALISSIIIFSAEVQHTADGFCLAFVALPEVFMSLPGGTILATAFFVLLSLAALSSSISMHESITAYVSEEHKMSRHKAACIVSGFVGILAILSSLSLGVTAGWTIGGRPFFAFLDWITSNYMMPITGIATAVFVGWIWDKQILKEELTRLGGFDSKLYPLIRFLIRWVCPILVLIIFITSLL